MSGLILPNYLVPSGILPKYWFITFDKQTNCYYYFNTYTKERTWKLSDIYNVPTNLFNKNLNPLLNTINILPPPLI